MSERYKDTVIESRGLYKCELGNRKQQITLAAKELII
jgi:hypothetical protein